MKVQFSVVFSGASGKAGDVVASRWKGRSYVRRRVIPANPRSTLQTTQRNFLAKIVGWWHDLKVLLKDSCDELGATWSVSGFNAFVARNLKDMADAVDERLIPLNSPVNPIDNLVAVVGLTIPGDIDLTWTQGEATTGQKIFLAWEKTSTPAGQSAIAYKDSGVLVEAESTTLGDLDPGEEYNVWAFVERAAAAPITQMFSIARRSTATSKAT